MSTSKQFYKTSKFWVYVSCFFIVLLFSSFFISKLLYKDAIREIERSDWTVTRIDGEVIEIDDLRIDRDNNLWLVTDNGLYFYNQNELTLIDEFGCRSGGMSDKFDYIEIDTNNVIWYKTAKCAGISGNFSSYQDGQVKEYPDYRSFYIDANDELWGGKGFSGGDRLYNLTKLSQGEKATIDLRRESDLWNLWGVSSDNILWSTFRTYNTSSFRYLQNGEWIPISPAPFEGYISSSTDLDIHIFDEEGGFWYLDQKSLSDEDYYLVNFDGSAWDSQRIPVSGDEIWHIIYHPSMSMDSFGRVWIRASDKLLIYNGTDWNDLSTVVINDYIGEISNIYIDQSDTLWVMSGTSLLALSLDNRVPRDIVISKNSAYIYKLLTFLYKVMIPMLGLASFIMLTFYILERKIRSIMQPTGDQVTQDRIISIGAKIPTNVSRFKYIPLIVHFIFIPVYIVTAQFSDKVPFKDFDSKALLLLVLVFPITAFFVNLVMPIARSLRETVRFSIPSVVYLLIVGLVLSISEIYELILFVSIVLASGGILFISMVFAAWFGARLSPKEIIS